MNTPPASPAPAAPSRRDGSATVGAALSPVWAPKPYAALWPILAGAAVVALAGDFLLWGYQPGLSLAIFFALGPVMLLLARGRAAWNRRSFLALTLYLPACVQTAVEICFTNVAVLLILACVLLGETTYFSLPAGWARWWEGCVALLKAPLRWIWLGQQAAANAAEKSTAGKTGGPDIGRAVRIAAPALLVGLVFVIVFANGNAVFSDGISRAWESFARWIANFEITVPRVLFWLALATLGLVWFHPAPAPATPRLMTREPIPWPCTDVPTAAWQSYAILGLVNVIFCAVNTIDATYLWMHRELPAGVSLYQFMHDGTNSLITATVLAAIILALVFQQHREVAERPVLKWLAIIWIAQNLALLSSVVLRLQMYLEISQLHTAKRIHLGCFLALVALGFIFLALHILRRTTLGRLFWRNALSVFTLFYVLQFVNTTGIAARWNVDAWLEDTKRGFDTAYLIRQGDNAWSQLVRLAQAPAPDSLPVRMAQAEVRRIADSPTSDPATQNWREIQFRCDAYAREVRRAAGTF